MKHLKSSVLIVGMTAVLTACGGGDGSDDHIRNEVTQYPIADTFEKIYTRFTHYTLKGQGKDYENWKLMLTTQPRGNLIVNGTEYLVVRTITEAVVNGKSTGKSEADGFSTTNPFTIVSNPNADLNRYHHEVDSHAVLPKTAKLDQVGDFFISSTYDDSGTKVQETKRTWYLNKVSNNRASLCAKTVSTDVRKKGIERDKTATACYEIDKNGTVYNLQLTLITPIDGELQVINFES